MKRIPLQGLSQAEINTLIDGGERFYVESEMEEEYPDRDDNNAFWVDRDKSSDALR